ncbi:putative transcription factor bHLH family [Helianthus annuus]|nr:putative transcription factor bHLH family [Helianthus annuus]
MEYPHELMNQPGIYSYSELAEVFSSQGYKGYENLTTRNQHIGATTTNLVMQESNMATSTSSFAPIFGSSLNTFSISFGDITSPATINQNEISGGYKLDYHNALKATEKMNLNELHGSIELPKRVSGTTRRNRRQAQDHILAERKRREKLNQLFMSLYARLPEIKKVLIYVRSQFLDLKIGALCHINAFTPYTPLTSLYSTSGDVHIKSSDVSIPSPFF